MLTDLDINLFFGIQQYIPTLIILHDLRMHITGQVYVDGVQMGNPAHSGNFVVASRQIAGQMAGEHGILADFQIYKTQLGQITLQQLSQLTLARSGRYYGSTLHALGINSSIAQKTRS